jgi:hypothetical protein
MGIMMISGVWGRAFWRALRGLIYAGLAKVLGDRFGILAGRRGPYFVPLSGTTKGLERSALRFLRFLL